MTTKKNIKDILRKNKPEVSRRAKLKDRIKSVDLKGIGMAVAFLAVLVVLVYIIFFWGENKRQDDSSIIQSGIEELKKGNIEEAERKFESVLRKDSSNLEAVYNLAIVKYNKKEREDAIHDLGVVIKLDPDNEKAYNVLGNVYRDLGNNDEAIRSYTEAIKNNSKFVSPYANLAVLLSDMNRDEEAMKIVFEGLKNIPNDPSLKSMEKTLLIDLSY